jgi:hypothetical protein
MVIKECWQCFCVLALVGLVAARSNQQISALKRGSSLSFSKAKPFWGDYIDCNEYDDETLLPNIYNCRDFFMCWGGELFEFSCEEGEIFSRETNFCEDENETECVEEPWPDPDEEVDEGCPPPGSNDLVFLPSFYCDEYFICINGRAIPMLCRPGLHWNMYEGKEICVV